jgi:ribosomal protein S18 acetylase RimI-like enzyme
MIKEMTRLEFEEFWPVFKSVIEAQETYAFDSDMTLDQAYDLWCAKPLRSFAFIENGKVLGSYYLKANAMGPSNHICNCGYMVDERATGRGIARQLCEHSQKVAVDLGFKAMQFNSVVSSNSIAVRLWEKLGFTIIGTIPDAYRHPKLGYVDSYIMHKQLAK